MNAWACVRSAVRALRANLLRGALTMLGIVIGVAAVIAMVARRQRRADPVAEQIRPLGANLSGPVGLTKGGRGAAWRWLAAVPDRIGCRCHCGRSARRFRRGPDRRRQRPSRAR